jgi:hypothetical protein
MPSFDGAESLESEPLGPAGPLILPHAEAPR